jgi:mannose-6-phosphate isomerase-like protein (cupin superfamily)
MSSSRTVTGVQHQPLLEQHSDDRRTIREVLVANTDGSVLRVTHITVHTAEAGPLGNHWHPWLERFIVLSGTFTVTLENIDTGERDEFTVTGPAVLDVPPRTAHAFVAHGPGELMSQVGREFRVDDMITHQLV